jgi:hypothetical protein
MFILAQTLLLNFCLVTYKTMETSTKPSILIQNVILSFDIHSVCLLKRKVYWVPTIKWPDFGEDFKMGEFFSRVKGPAYYKSLI